jgi:hypothetical protein
VKKGAIPIETITILVIAVVVLIVLVLFFMGYLGRGKVTMSAVEAQSKFNEACTRLAGRGCILAGISAEPKIYDYCACWQCECDINKCPSSTETICGSTNVKVCSDEWILKYCDCPCP